MLKTVLGKNQDIDFLFLPFQKVMTKTNNHVFREPMTLPLWRSIYSINLMLPKEDRRAMLLRLFNDSEPVLHNLTNKTPSAVEEIESTESNDVPGEDSEMGVISNAEVIGRTEEEIIKSENLIRGEEQEDLVTRRETYQLDGDEEDRFNTTV